MKPFTTRVLGLARPVFRRTLGVKPHTYFEMRGVLEEREAKKTKQGRIPALDLDDQLVLTLQFWREYRTHHHLSLDWEVDESTVRRTIERVENALIKSGKFSLPGRKALRDNVDFEVIVVDVAENPIERPKKSNDEITVGRKTDTHSKIRL
jgi:Helix-turn-helix of DDE superfamily endonuclease